MVESTIRYLHALQSLNLYNTEVRDLAPLTGLTALNFLELSGTTVTDLAPAQELPNLKRIIGAPKAELQNLNVYRAKKGLPDIADQY
jgi:hypothetical protein